MKTSKQLMQAVQDFRNGKRDAFQTLYEQSYRYLYTCVMHIVKNEETAQDILQDTYLEIVKSIGALKNPQDFLSWAAVIANRKCFAYLKKNKELLSEDPDGMLEETADDTALIPEEIMQNREKQRLIQEIINGLSDMQRLCVIGYYYNEQSVDNLAQEFQIPSGTVKSHLSRARAKIRMAVEELDVKKGTKLYGMAPLMLLLLEEEAKACVIKPMPAALAAGTEAVAAGSISPPGKLKTAWKKLTKAAKMKATAAAAAVCTTGAVAAAFWGGGQETLRISEEVQKDFDEIMKICADGDYEKLCHFDYSSEKRREEYPSNYRILFCDENDTHAGYIWQYDGESRDLKQKQTGYGLGVNPDSLTLGYFENGKANGKMIYFYVIIHGDGTVEDATGPDGLDCTEVVLYEVSIQNGVPDGPAVKACYEIDSSLKANLVYQTTGTIKHSHLPDASSDSEELFYFDGRIEYYERFHEPYTHILYVKEGKIDADRTKRENGIWVDESGEPCGNFISSLEPDEKSALFILHLPKNLLDIEAVKNL